MDFNKPLPPREFYVVPFDKAIFKIDTRYKDLKQIGHGSYGIVCSAYDTLTGKTVAIKKITNMFLDLVDAKRIVREVRILRHLCNHANIVELVDLFAQPYGSDNFEDLYLIMELYESDLDRIIASSQELTDSHFQYFLYQILRGMKYFHSANILHRDMKPPNLLVNSNCDLAICDFGLGRGMDGACEGTGVDMTCYVVTRWYRAPELLLECERYGPSVDVWSVGCIFAEMLRRKPFLKGRDYLHQLKLIFRVLGRPDPKQLSFISNPRALEVIRNLDVDVLHTFEEYFPRCSPVAVDLLKKMLKFNPDERITVDAALNHPYLASLHRADDEPTCPSKYSGDWEKGYGEEIPKAKQQDILRSDLEYFEERRKHTVIEKARRNPGLVLNSK